jgi:hypothetical protein
MERSEEILGHGHYRQQANNSWYAQEQGLALETQMGNQHSIGFNQGFIISQWAWLQALWFHLGASQ